MQELTQHELTSASGGAAPAAAVLVLVVAGAGIYSAAKSIYEFGKALGHLAMKNQTVIDTE